MRNSLVKAGGKSHSVPFWIALIGLELLLVVGIATGLARGWRETSELLSQELTELDRLRAIARFKDKIKADSGDDVFSGAFLGDATPAVLSADLISKLKAAAASAGIEVLSANSIPPRVEGAVTLVGTNLQMSGNWPALIAFLQQTEQAQPLLIVDRLVLRSNLAPGVSETSDTILQADVDVFGAIRTASVTPTAGTNP